MTACREPVSEELETLVKLHDTKFHLAASDLNNVLWYGVRESRKLLAIVGLQSMGGAEPAYFVSHVIAYPGPKEKRALTALKKFLDSIPWTLRGLVLPTNEAMLKMLRARATRPGQRVWTEKAILFESKGVTHAPTK